MDQPGTSRGLLCHRLVLTRYLSGHKPATSERSSTGIHQLEPKWIQVLECVWYTRCPYISI
jgi:hypothetical protein